MKAISMALTHRLEERAEGVLKLKHIKVIK